jgi:[ribosomal protein S18]-alanine N-acetyltransferase
MRSIAIVSASDADRAWAAAVMASSEPWLTLGRGREHCLAVCRDPAYDVFVAKEKVARCGVLVLQRRGVAGSPYIVSLAVAAERRGCGIGTRLLEFAEETARAHSAHLFLCVSSFNVRARRFYERHGFVAVGELPDYVVRGASELLMHKRLTAA